VSTGKRDAPACLSLSACGCAMAPWAVDPLSACVRPGFRVLTAQCHTQPAPLQRPEPTPRPRPRIRFIGRGRATRPTGYFSSFLHEFYLPTGKCTLCHKCGPSVNALAVALVLLFFITHGGIVDVVL
jgi:hypothetical protein